MGVRLAQRNGEEIITTIIKIIKISKGNPAKKTGIQPDASTINAVPKSGCLKIRKLLLKIATSTTTQSFIVVPFLISS